LGAAILMMKTQIGLGVLSIPLVFDTLGMIPGIIILVSIAAITTWVCGKSEIPIQFTAPF
jgi:amino acid permease